MNRAIAALVAAAVALGIVGISVDWDGHDPTITIHTQNNKKIEVPKEQVDAIVHSEDPHANLGAENGVTPQVLKRDDAAASPLAPRIVGPTPLAAPHQAGCLTRTLRVNYSHRTGTRPSLVVLHFTVSGNRTGWDDVNAIVGFFNRSATQASSNYVIDNEGHCALIVPEAEKAWAQAGFNSATACSFEVINTGSESTYVGPDGGAGQAKLAKVVRDCAKRWHIPLRRGATSGCSVVRSGVVDHQTLGGCGGGHSDIGKFRGVDIDKTIRNASKGTVIKKKASSHEAALCEELQARRKKGQYGNRNRSIVKTLRKHKVTCSAKFGAVQH